MYDVSAIYAYIGTLKEKPEGDFAAYQERVKTAEIAFRSALTQVALEKEDGKGLILFIRDFQDLAETLRDFHPKTKAEKAQAEWLAFEAMKAEEAVVYMERVQQDISDSETPSSSPRVRDDKRLSAVRVISGTEGLAKFLGCGKTKAFAIIDSGVLKKAGIQYKVGRCWKFNAERLSDFLKQNPDFLR